MNASTANAAWRVVGLGASVGASSVTRIILRVAWRRFKGGDPPVNPASRSTTWPEAIAYAALSGALIGLVRMAATRGAASTWESVLGDLPPGLEDVG